MSYRSVKKIFSLMLFVFYGQISSAPINPLVTAIKKISEEQSSPQNFVDLAAYLKQLGVLSSSQLPYQMQLKIKEKYGLYPSDIATRATQLTQAVQDINTMLTSGTYRSGPGTFTTTTDANKFLKLTNEIGGSKSPLYTNLFADTTAYANALTQLSSTGGGTGMGTGMGTGGPGTGMGTGGPSGGVPAPAPTLPTPLPTPPAPIPSGPIPPAPPLPPFLAGGTLPPGVPPAPPFPTHLFPGGGTTTGPVVITSKTKPLFEAYSKENDYLKTLYTLDFNPEQTLNTSLSGIFKKFKKITDLLINPTTGILITNPGIEAHLITNPNFLDNLKNHIDPAKIPPGLNDLATSTFENLDYNAALNDITVIMSFCTPTTVSNSVLQDDIKTFFNLAQKIQKLFIDYKKIKTAVPPADVQTAQNNARIARDNAETALKTQRSSVLADPAFQASVLGKTADEQTTLFNQAMISTDTAQANILKPLITTFKDAIKNIDKNKTPSVLFPDMITQLTGGNSLSSTLNGYTTPLDDLVNKFTQIQNGIAPTPTVITPPSSLSLINEKNPIYVTDTVINYDNTTTPFAVNIKLDPIDNNTISDKITPYNKNPQIGILKVGYDTPTTAPVIDTSLYSFIPDSSAVVTPLTNSVGGYDLYVWGPEFVPAPAGMNNFDYLKSCIYFAEVQTSETGNAIVTQSGAGSGAKFTTFLRLNKAKIVSARPIKNTKLYLVRSYISKTAPTSGDYIDKTYSTLLKNISLMTRRR